MQNESRNQCINGFPGVVDQLAEFLYHGGLMIVEALSRNALELNRHSRDVTVLKIWSFIIGLRLNAGTGRLILITRHVSCVTNRYPNLIQLIFVRGNTLYNSAFTMKVFQHCLSITNKTSPGIENVSYSTIIHSHPSLQNVILQTYNHFFTETHSL